MARKHPAVRRRRRARPELPQLPFSRVELKADDTVADETIGEPPKPARGNPPRASASGTIHTHDRDETMRGVVARLTLQAGDGIVGFRIELDDYDVGCVKHPDEPTWFVCVWRTGEGDPARSPEGKVLATARYVPGTSVDWRERSKLDANTLAVVSHAVVRAVDEHEGRATP